MKKEILIMLALAGVGVYLISQKKTDKGTQTVLTNGNSENGQPEGAAPASAIQFKFGSWVMYAGKKSMVGDFDPSAQKYRIIFPATQGPLWVSPSLLTAI